jgi:hypothetical protein
MDDADAQVAAVVQLRGRAFIVHFFRSSVVQRMCSWQIGSKMESLDYLTEGMSFLFDVGLCCWRKG